jgi:hypothetical protein
VDSSLDSSLSSLGFTSVLSSEKSGKAKMELVRATLSSMAVDVKLMIVITSSTRLYFLIDAIIGVLLSRKCINDNRPPKGS